MALLILENFVDWNGSLLSDEGVTVTGTPLIVTSPVPRGTCKAIELGNADNVKWPVDGAPSVLRFALRIYQGGSQHSNRFFAPWEGGNDHVFIGIDASGYLYAQRAFTLLGTASIDSIPLATWTHIEGKIVVDDAVGSVELRVNGSSTPALLLSGVDTKNGLTGIVNGVEIGYSGTGRTLYVTDLAVWTESGESPTGWIGDCRVDTFLPTAAGSSTDYTPSAGSNWECVEESDGDTSYIESSITADLDLFSMGNMTHTPATIHAVAVTAIARKTDSGTGSVKLTMKSGATTAQGSAEGLSDASYSREIYARGVDPATSAAWSKSAVDALEAGVESVL